jgi:DNA invertase Pin-like site-specific DNA recombinase
VAAYARVSLETEMLHHSLSAQVSYYSSLIQSNPEWEYVGVYADEGITGTSTKKRDEFKRLMRDCDEGKIDLVLVKSISRFARDTVDTLNATRHLRSLGIDVFFEREHIHSISVEGELLLTLLASFAQAEAESMSANVKWAAQKHFENGEPSTGILCFGYDWNPETRTLTINEEEGKWVRYIYRQYLAGASIKGLCNDLKKKGIRGKRGDLIGRTTLRRILTTETYVGDLLLQRYFSPEIHKPRLNKGEVEKVLVSNAHEPLVSREDYAKVQERISQRAETADNHGYEKTIFAGLVKCGKCGYACNHVRHRRGEVRYAHIECNRRKTKECDLLPIREEELMDIMEQTVGEKDKPEKIMLFDDHVDFTMPDGTVRTHIREYPQGGYCATPFSRKIFCGYCGSVLTRCGGNLRRASWMCSTRKYSKAGCTHELMSEGELYGAARAVLGTDENLEMQIYCRIEKTVSYNDRIDFYMKEGGIRTWQRR